MFKEHEDGIGAQGAKQQFRLEQGKPEQTNFPYSGSTFSSTSSTAKALVEELEKFYSFRVSSMSTLVHELRSPISSIEMAISMLEIRLKQKGLLLNPDHYLPQYLNMLRQECDRSIRLADDLQTGWMKVLQADSLGGADAVVMEDDSLPPLERQAIADLSAELTFIAQPFWYITRQRGQIFKVAVPQSLPSITTNHSAVTHILTELLTQACRYTPAGETITLSASLQPDGLALRLVSTGVEIPSSQLPFLFKPYHLVPHHLRWQRDETGLGLPLVKQLTEQIGATIQVDSMAQQTTFTVLLPV